MQLELNLGFAIAQPMINAKLEENPIQLPTSVLGLFKLKSINLGYYDDYLYAGVTPVFDGPKIVPRITLDDEEFL